MHEWMTSHCKLALCFSQLMPCSPWEHWLWRVTAICPGRSPESFESFIELHQRSLQDPYSSCSPWPTCRVLRDGDCEYVNCFLALSHRRRKRRAYNATSLLLRLAATTECLKQCVHTLMKVIYGHIYRGTKTQCALAVWPAYEISLAWLHETKCEIG